MPCVCDRCMSDGQSESTQFQEVYVRRFVALLGSRPLALSAPPLTKLGASHGQTCPPTVCGDAQALLLAALSADLRSIHATRNGSSDVYLSQLSCERGVGHSGCVVQHNCRRYAPHRPAAPAALRMLCAATPRQAAHIDFKYSGGPAGRVRTCCSRRGRQSSATS